MRRALPVIGVVVLVGVAALFTWRSIDRPAGGGDADGPMAFAPADTPYVIGMLEPFPQAVIDDWMQRADSLGPLYARQLDDADRALARQGGDQAPGARVLAAVRAEFAGKTPQQALAVLGMDGRGRMALYGVGLVPVLRMELADPDAFTGFVTRMEEQAGQPLPRASVEGRDYWRFAIEEARVDALLAVLDGHLVATVAPAGADAAVLRTLLGLKRPAVSADADLARVNGELGFTDHFSGYLDTGRLLAALTREPTPVEAAFLTALQIDRPSLEPACRDEYAALAVSWPRVAFGYTEVATDRLVADTVIQTSKAIAQDLMKLRAPMPGMALVDADTPMNLGLSLKLSELPALVDRHAAAIEATPFQCPELAWINAGATGARTQVNNPALFAAAPVFHGFHLVLDHLAFSDTGEPSEAAGTLVIGSDNPQSLLAMARSFVPTLANVQIAPDGKVHALPLEGLPNAELAGPAHVAMGEHLIGIAFGQGQQARLPDALTIDAQQQPLLVFGYGGAVYEQLATLSSRMAADTGDAATREQAERTAAIMREIASRWLRRVEQRVEFTERGIEIRQTIELP
ncbi:MAG TPA: hypothetical protein VFG21_10985 [Xanthomonadaceae bacterium]|nr:hypothetical protein [Xanthomonadaceae bacterium]